jgi:simple sugar transport system permease protein
MGIYFQTWMPSIPAQVFQVAPFPLMIFTLLLMSPAQKESIGHIAAAKPWLRPLLKFFSGRAPSALGKPFRLE